MEQNFYKFKLKNDEEVNLTLNFASLLKIKSEYNDLYEEFIRLMQGAEDFDVVYDSLKIFYVAYLCANIKNGEYYSEDEFIELLPFNLEQINLLVNKMMMAGK